MPQLGSLIRTLVFLSGAALLFMPAALHWAPAFAQGVATRAAGIDLANLDRTCKPCDDFYRFATGGWRSANMIPPGHASWGSFNALQQQNEEALHSILEQTAADTAAPAGSDQQKLGTFYRACMDEAGIERAGTQPIAPLLQQVDGIADARSVPPVAAALQAAGVGDGPRFTSMADRKNSAITIAALAPGGLGMPDRDYM